MEESKDSEFSTYIQVSFFSSVYISLLCFMSLIIVVIIFLIQKNIRSIADSIKFSSNLPVGTARVNFIACFPRFQNEVRPFSDQILWM